GSYIYYIPTRRTSDLRRDAGDRDGRLSPGDCMAQRERAYARHGTHHAHRREHARVRLHGRGSAHVGEALGRRLSADEDGHGAVRSEEHTSELQLREKL